MDKFIIEEITVETGTRKDDLLKVAPLPDGNTFGIPMIIINGVEPGPVLCINSGTHGDEPEGTLAITDLAIEIVPKKLTGTLVLIPVLNVPAFMGKASVDVSGLRENPLDWKNLARTFPGNPSGTMTERLADTVVNKLLPKIDYAIDCHSGGTRGTSHWISGYAGVENEKLSKKSLEIAKSFPLKTLWRIPPWAKFATCCVEKDVAVCVVETTGQGRADESDVDVLIKGFRNVMINLGMIKGELASVPVDRKCIDSETYLYAEYTGIIRAKVKTGDLIKKNQLLGLIQDFYGNVKQEVKSPLTGIATGVRTKPMVWAGEPVFLVANFIEEGLVGQTSARTDISPP